MTTYYVDFGRADDTGDGLSWAAAKKTLQAALTLASGGSDVILWHSGSAETVAADVTLTAGANITILSVDKDNSDALTAGAAIGAQATNYSVTLSGAFKWFIRGVTFQTGTNATITEAINVGATSVDGAMFVFEDCKFYVNSSNSAGATLTLGAPATSLMNSYISLRDCTVKFSNVAQSIVLRGAGEALNLTLDATSAVPTNLFTSSHVGTNWIIEGSDLSRATSGLVGDAAGNGNAEIRFANCKIGAATILATQTTVLNKGGTTVWLFNCASGDTHYNLFHGDPFGSTEVSASIYANDGASYDGTNRVSWRVKTTANASFYQPYVSPWIDVYHAGTAAVTPYLECVRSGNTTPYTDAEVWSEFSYQGTADSTKATIVGDRAVPLASGSAQAASSLSGADWTGENATSAFFKIGPSASITPAEIGDVRARVVVGLANVTDLYVDPLPRGLA